MRANRRETMGPSARFPKGTAGFLSYRKGFDEVMAPSVCDDSKEEALSPFP